MCPIWATWLLMARAHCGDAGAARGLPALIEKEGDVSNAKVAVRVLAQTAGAQSAPLLRALKFEDSKTFAQGGNFDFRNQLRAAVRDELRLLGSEPQQQLLGFGP